MIQHSITIVQAAVQHINPGEVPVLAADQPLFALAKQIQWTWPNTLGENHFVIMYGGLHRLHSGNRLNRQITKQIAGTSH